jgi:hypothetical protein
MLCHLYAINVCWRLEHYEAKSIAAQACMWEKTFRHKARYYIYLAFTMTKTVVCLFLIAVIVAGGLTAFSAVAGAEVQNATSSLISPPVGSQTYGQYSMGATNYGGKQDDWAYCIRQTSDIGLILAGQTRSYGAGGSDMWLLKTGLASYTMENGVTGAYQREQWNVTFGGASDDGAFSVIQTSDGGFAVAGFTGSFGAGGKDMWLVKTDRSGNMQWNQTYGGTGDDAAVCLVQAVGGGYLMSGYTNSVVQSQTAWVVKTDNTGNMEWSTMLAGVAANSIVSTLDGGYAFAVENQDAFGFVRTTATGQVLAEHLYPAAGRTASAQSIVQADDGGYAIAGWVSNAATGLHDAWLVKIDVSGQHQWSRTFADWGAYSLIKTSKGDYALTGDRAFLILTDASGNVLWNRLYDGQTGNGSQYFTRMQSIIEASPDHFVLAGVHNGGQYVNLQFQWIEVSLKSGEQLVPPEITILSPVSTTYNRRSVPLTFYVNEPTRFLSYRVNGFVGFNFTLSGNTTLENLPNGNYSVTVFATDMEFNTASSQAVSFSVNSSVPYVVPKVTIQSPVSQTYNSTQIQLEFTVDQRVFWTAYSLDGQENKTALSKLILFIEGGTHQLTVYAGYTVGGEAGSATVTFTVSPFACGQPLPWSSSNGTYGDMISQFFQATAQIVFQQAFLIIGIVFFALGVSIIVIGLVFRRNISKQKRQPRMVR